MSEAAREGLRQAIRRHRVGRDRDREAYLACPEAEDTSWENAEASGEP